MVGATSATGEAVLERLARRYGSEGITRVVRPSSNVTALINMRVEFLVGDVCDEQTMKSILSPDATYLDMTHPRYYPVSVPLVAGSGVRRAFYVTTTGIFSRYHSCSEIYKSGESIIKGSGLSWTILRPSMIYGNSRDRNMSRLIRFLARHRFFPLFGWDSLMQPVHYQDLADGIAAAVETPQSVGRAYNLAGPSPIRYVDIVRTIVATLGKQVRFIRVPARPAYLAARAFEKLPGFPVTAEQVMRLQEDKAFDIADACTDLQYRPRSFAVGIAEEIRSLRESHCI
jgi:nucleoside-diphosphate-sugar epimerase